MRAVRNCLLRELRKYTIGLNGQRGRHCSTASASRDWPNVSRTQRTPLLDANTKIMATAPGKYMIQNGGIRPSCLARLIFQLHQTTTRLRCCKVLFHLRDG